ncbi:MAG: HTTM domain-containing protein [Pseudonocardia sp.]|nr:HTTM domain-containing protein [Pseudonocardia sp.]
MTLGAELFPRVPVRRLAAVRIVVAAYTVVDLLVYRSWIASAAAPDVLHEPFGLLRVLHAPRLDTAPLAALWGTSVLLGIVVLVGWHARPAAFTLALTYGWWLGEHWAYGVPNHGRTVIVVALVVLSTSPSGLRWSLDARRSRRRGTPEPPATSRSAGWAIEVVALQLTFLYFCSAVFKLVYAGPGWWHGGAIEAGIVLVGPQWSLELASDHLGVLHALALGALLWELAAPLLLVRGRCRRGYAMTAILFHLSVLLVMGVDFTGMAVACLAMFRLERAGQRIVVAAGVLGDRADNSVAAEVDRVAGRTRCVPALRPVAPQTEEEPQRHGPVRRRAASPPSAWSPWRSAHALPVPHPPHRTRRSRRP